MGAGQPVVTKESPGEDQAWRSCGSDQRGAMRDGRVPRTLARAPPVDARRKVGIEAREGPTELISVEVAGELTPHER